MRRGQQFGRPSLQRRQPLPRRAPGLRRRHELGPVVGQRRRVGQGPGPVLDRLQRGDPVEETVNYLGVESLTVAAQDGDDDITVDGTTGDVFLGQLATLVPDINDPYLIKLLGWADEIRRLGVWTNADKPEEAARARSYGAEGIGLCRTEHMFFDEGRISAMREMIIAETQSAREAALKKLLPFQRKDFEGIFTAMKGLPVTVRLLDPPLHEFLPHEDKEGHHDRDGITRQAEED